MTTALELPEITGILGELLDKKTLQSCVLVSRSFYTSYAPFLWRKVTLEGSEQLIDLDILKALAHHVQDLNINHSIPSEYYSVKFKRLKSLRLYMEQGYTSNPPAGDTVGNTCLDYTQFARLNPTIDSLLFFDMRLPSFIAFWDTIAADWENPKNIPSSTILPSLTFPRVTTMTLDFLDKHLKTNNFRPLDQLVLVKACPHLTALRWNAKEDEPSSLVFKQELDKGAWPKLTSLHLSGGAFQDNIIATIIKSAPGLKELHNSSGNFGPEAHASIIQSQGNILEWLNVKGCTSFTGAMAQEILSRCPLLKRFEASNIHLKDIAQSTLSWICLELEQLHIHVVKRPEDPTEWERDVYGRLSRLTRLKHFDMSVGSRGFLTDGSPASELSLDLSLASGLGSLASLREMETFHFEGTIQEMGRDEIQWMMDHWKKLTKVGGWFSKDRGQHQELATLLDERGIKCDMIRDGEFIISRFTHHMVFV
ncbi:hypothetical protein BGX26_003630 [Mortierella sp. AD094]|nr:hypothetical protein BGX26_003630 [Mortierella sp. AD094]